MKTSSTQYGVCVPMGEGVEWVQAKEEALGTSCKQTTLFLTMAQVLKGK
jgi:hypothetical protein